MPNDPMITIKKPDGTFVKVTMAEFLAMKKQKNTQTIAPVVSPTVNQSQSGTAMIQEKPVEKTTVVTPATKTENSFSTVLPSNPVNIRNRSGNPKDSSLDSHKEVRKPLTSIDARSPLEEKITVKSKAPLTSHKREAQVDEVVRRLGFGVSSDLLNRFRSLILARLKDIKSAEQMRGQLLQPVKNGGFGLNVQQEEKINKIIEEVLSAVESEHDKAAVPALKGKPGMSLMVEPPELPAIAADVSPKKYNEAYQSQQVVQPKPDLVPANDVVSKLVKESLANEPIFTISTKSTPKTFIQDISAPAVEMGPVEELRSVTLGDFRKLSSNPEEAAKRLQQKILNLQAESFVWYLDGLSAYHNSPLYLEYMQAVSQSLAERKSLANVLMMKNGIKLSEALAIVEMEKSL